MPSFDWRWTRLGERVYRPAAGWDPYHRGRSGGPSVGRPGAAYRGRPRAVGACRLLLLDEPAASLDAHSEQRVMQALTHASTQQTTLLVTHQLEGLADWDAVWVMQDGQIIEQGDYATLARAGGVFSALLAHRQEEI